MKKLLNFGKPYTLGFIQELLLGLIILIGFIGFSNSQFYSEILYKDFDQSIPDRFIKITDDFYSYSVDVSGGGSSSTMCGTYQYSTNTSSSCSTYNNCKPWIDIVIPSISSDGRKCMFKKSDLPVGTTALYVRGYNSNMQIYLKYASSVMPVSALTPAIDGLKGTVVELIPYIIFIGIGMLIATLGFYAIRRLVNWIGGKVNSNFKSKS